MKRLLIDLQALQGGNVNRGIGRYITGFLTELCASSPTLKIDFFINGSSTLDTSFVAGFIGSLEGAHKTHVWYPPSGRYAKNSEVADTALEAFYLNLNPDLILIPSLFEGLDNAIYTKVSKNIQTAVIVYDLIPLVHPERYLQGTATLEWYRSKLPQLESASALLCISKATLSDVSRLLNVTPSALQLVGTGNSSALKPSVADSTSRVNQTLLYVGGIDWRKNIDGLLAAFAKSKARQAGLRLKIVCSSNERQTKRVLGLAGSLGIKRSQIEMTGFVSDSQLANHYAQAKFTIFPSLYEGFGLPVLESLALGKTAVVSNTTSLVEIQTNPVAQFDPRNPWDMARVIDEVFFDSDLLLSLEREAPALASRHTWKKVVANFNVALGSLQIFTNNADSESSKSKLTLAFFSPLPPSKSGIAFHSLRLLPALAERYDVTVIDSANSAQMSEAAGVPVRNLDWFKSNASRFDRVVYQIGNSFWHQEAIDTLKWQPGVVVIHDFFLGGFYHWLQGGSGDSESWPEAIFHSHGYSPLASYRASQNLPYLASNYPVNLEIQQNALATLFHSERALTLNKKWTCVPKEPDLQALIPLVPTIEYVADSQGDDHVVSLHGVSPEDFVVATFGFTADIKGHLELIQAISEIRGLVSKRIVLVCVGDHSSPRFASTLLAEVAKQGLQKCFISTGWTSDEDYRAWLRRADLVVQLRKTLHGESSAALLDALSYGNTVLTNRNLAEGSKGEFLRVLDSEFTVREIAESLLELVNRETNPDQISTEAFQYVSRYHSPKALAEAYWNHVEAAYQSGPARMFDYLEASKVGNLTENQRRSLASSLADSVAPTPRVQQIFIDVSELGAQVKGFPKALATEMLMVDEPGLVVIPVYFDSDLKLFAPDHHFARSVFHADSWESGYGDHIQAWHGDVLVDLNSKATIGADTVLARMQASGVNVVSIRQDKSMVTKSGRELVALLRDQKQAAPLD